MICVGGTVEDAEDAEKNRILREQTKENEGTRGKRIRQQNIEAEPGFFAVDRCR